MKKTKEIYPPLQMIKDYNKKGRITWEQMDEMRTVLRKRGRYKTSDLAYITLLEVLFAMNCYDKIRDDEYENAVRIANIVSALASWRISKQVYRFNMDLELALYQQAGDDQIPVEVLKSLPYPCVYMESPNLQDDQYHGFFVYYDMDQYGTDVLKFLVLCRNGQEVAVRGFELLEGKTLRECIAEVLRKCYQRESVDDEVQEHIELAEKMLQLVLYICSANADIQPVEPKTSGTLRRFEDIKDCYREIRKWDVGMRMVSQNRRRTEKHIKKTKQQSGRSNYEPVVHYRLAPHVRRGHWHTYWTGKKDGSAKRKLILKWIPFTYVNVGKLEELPTVVNVMKNQ